MKDSLRAPLIQARKKLSTSEVSEKSKSIVKTIVESDYFKSSHNIAFYHAVNGEADPQALLSSVGKNQQKQFYLPVLSKKLSQGLVFAPFSQKTIFKNNKFSIPEPVIESDKTRNANELDLIIVPLLGFDRKGNRLGMGGGYYDRSLSFRLNNKNKPVLIGFAYKFQELDNITHEPWDVKLDFIATEDELITV